MIQINNLSFGYHKKKYLFDNLNLGIKQGNIYGLLGRNGAGKTTLLKQMIGLLFPGKGECLVFDSPASARLPHVLDKIYFIPEEFILPPISMNAFVKLHAPFYPKFNHDLLKKSLGEFEISENNKLNALSYGQKKKFLIAFGLATMTPLLILDEPTNGLDIPSKSQFRKIMASAMDDERSIIISTHQVRDLSSLLDHIIILEDGKAIFDHSTADISSKLAFIQTRDLSGLEVLFSEETLGGYAVMCRKNSEETRIDLELLFNGVVSNPAGVNNEFNS
ncbi:MAG: ABC transporter ATP-binding protein [Bacteroidales bacterium]